MGGTVGMTVAACSCDPCGVGGMKLRTGVGKAVPKTGAGADTAWTREGSVAGGARGATGAEAVMSMSILTSSCRSEGVVTVPGPDELGNPEVVSSVSSSPIGTSISMS
jgi:hypothetical protein